VRGRGGWRERPRREIGLSGRISAQPPDDRQKDKETERQRYKETDEEIRERKREE
jgi:hypothetical protein